MKTTLTLVAVLMGLSSGFAQTEWNKEVPASPDDPENTPAMKITGRIYNLSGIGAILKKKDTSFVIMEAIPGSGAEEGGLKTGDAITHVDGKFVGTMELREVVGLLRGNPGTTVVLKVERPGESPRNITVTRRPIPIPGAPQ